MPGRNADGSEDSGTGSWMIYDVRGWGMNGVECVEAVAFEDVGPLGHIIYKGMDGWMGLERFAVPRITLLYPVQRR